MGWNGALEARGVDHPKVTVGNTGEGTHVGEGEAFRDKPDSGTHNAQDTLGAKRGSDSNEEARSDSKTLQEGPDTGDQHRRRS